LKEIFCTLLLTLTFLTACWITPVEGSTFETESLTIRDNTGSISSVDLEARTKKVDLIFTEVLQFWSTNPQIKQFGKIIVEFDSPLQGANSSIFFWEKEKGQRVRIVRVFGGGENPHQLAHKLTSALFPNPDKLIRNMMGEISEIRFGNPLSFPMCGFDKDYWVAALLQIGSYIPLTKIGSDHSDWGMEFHNNGPKVKDRAKQHACYAEAGSFGEFLITTYGREKMKNFHLLSRSRPRPWEEVFGLSLEQLEAKWLEAVRLKSQGKAAELTTLLRLLKDNSSAACFMAQKLSEKQRIGR